MKLFLDTANAADIKKWLDTGLIDGITTNPSLLSKQGGDPKKIILEICALLPEGDVSVEVTQTTPADVYKQAKEIAALAPNIVVKIPCHLDYYPIIKRLAEEEIALNITLVFSVIQGLFMSKLGVYYISPFVGRIEDNGAEGLALIEQLRQALDAYDYETEILAASIRTARQLHHVILSGADAVTIPASLMQTITTNLLTDQGMAQFNADWQKLGVKQFP